MSVARRALRSLREEPVETGAAELQRYANAGRALAAMSEDLMMAMGMAHSDVGFLCDALRKGQSCEGTCDAAADARSSISRAAANVASLLSLARPRGPVVAPLFLAEVVEAALFDLGACFGGLSIEKELQPEACALADRGALLQSLVSLLLDAADAAQPRGRILIAVWNDQPDCAILVEDDGPSPLQPESLLERAHTPLWICRNVLRSFGADLSVGIGSLGGRQVIIRLPSA
jgi:C4-dicarboxylate-specific signal transduction histidine kinase